MERQPKPDSHLDDMRELLVSFGLPALLIVVCLILLVTGIDGEVKSILAVAAGWIFRSGYKTARK